MHFLLKTVVVAAAAVISNHSVAQETRLLFTSLSPAGSTNSIFFNQWAQKIADQSGGTLKIEIRDGSHACQFWQCV